MPFLIIRNLFENGIRPRYGIDIEGPLEITQALSKQFPTIALQPNLSSTPASSIRLATRQVTLVLNSVESHGWTLHSSSAVSFGKTLQEIFVFTRDEGDSMRSSQSSAMITSTPMRDHFDAISAANALDNLEVLDKVRAGFLKLLHKYLQIFTPSSPSSSSSPPLSSPQEAANMEVTEVQTYIEETTPETPPAHPANDDDSNSIQISDTDSPTSPRDSTVCAGVTVNLTSSLVDESDPWIPVESS
jgi:hypothetical protein